VRLGKFIAWGWVTLGICLLPACNRQENETKPIVDGARIFASTCARCHGADGCGGDAIGLPSRSRICNVQASLSDQQAKQFIKQGKGSMPAFGDEFNDEQIAALVHHIRSFKPAQNH
jgi:mono/diheme cytochrome c family protein